MDVINVTQSRDFNRTLWIGGRCSVLDLGLRSIAIPGTARIRSLNRFALRGLRVFVSVMRLKLSSVP